jgi:hypothetical protein
MFQCLRPCLSETKAHQQSLSKRNRLVVSDEFWYLSKMTREQIEAVLENVRSWPREDQDELAEIARDIEARRKGLYRATAEELQALDEAEASGTADDHEIEAAFRAFRSA